MHTSFSAEPGFHFMDGTLMAERFNGFVDYLRATAALSETKRKLKDWKAGLKHQKESIRENLRATYDGYRDLLLVRVDFQYPEDALDERDALPRTGWSLDAEGNWITMPSQLRPVNGRAETRARIDTATATAMKDRERFFSNRRGTDRDLFEHMVTYFLKMETGGGGAAQSIFTVCLHSTASGNVISTSSRIAWGSAGTT
ncbi:hypothetical protein DIE07_27545 [Burkholderia sp. Bp9002]|nr:hypothetical protein DIE07_27545 [Burkholderia sp. Bp9002]